VALCFIFALITSELYEEVPETTLRGARNVKNFWAFSISQHLK
jgi:hypothetical protein